MIHVASHSFTPELNGHVRTADIGLLYDPARPGEVAFSSAWLAALAHRDPGLRLRRNYPYLGTSDGLTMALRRRHPPDRYIGVELEVNQRYVEAGGPEWPRIRSLLVESLGEALATVAAQAEDPPSRPIVPTADLQPCRRLCLGTLARRNSIWSARMRRPRRIMSSCRLRYVGQVVQRHVRLLGHAIALVAVARAARGDAVHPRVGAAARRRNDVLPRQVVEVEVVCRSTRRPGGPARRASGC